MNPSPKYTGMRPATILLVLLVQDVYARIAEDGWTTTKGCACQKRWEWNGKTITNYCGNPGNEEEFDWCMVESDYCEGVNWGYCARDCSAVLDPGFADPCPYARDGICDAGVACNAVGTDCYDCTYMLPQHVSCSDCTGVNGGAWCAAGALCAAFEPPDPTSALLLGDASLCGSSHDWVSTCTESEASPFVGSSDPAYEAQSWVFELINVKPAWAAGYTGDGVQIVINDDGLDLSSDEFAELPDGQLKFNAADSCLSTDVNYSFPDTENGLPAHGTACAAIAAGNANSFCSHGVAPHAKLAGCPILAPGVAQGQFTYPPSGWDDGAVFLTFGLSGNDISSNSWGIDPCTRLERRRAEAARKLAERQAERRRLQDGSCPFSIAISEAAGPEGHQVQSPCFASACPWASGVPAVMTADCEVHISSYCATTGNFETTELDQECHHYWHLWTTCAYSDLSPRVVRSLQYAVTHGRGGKGTIFVFAAGNSHGVGSNVNYEGYLFTR